MRHDLGLEARGRHDAQHVVELEAPRVQPQRVVQQLDVRDFGRAVGRVLRVALGDERLRCREGGVALGNLCLRCCESLVACRELLLPRRNLSVQLRQLLLGQGRRRRRR